MGTYGGRAGVAAAASTQHAVDAAARVVAEGGNAVDGALAAGLVAMVVEPGICSLGGGAYVTLAPADGSAPVVVDGNVEMPGRGLPGTRFGRGLREVTTGYGGGTTMTVGHGSVATPGAVQATEVAHRRYGRAPWREVVAPAYEAARDGFPLSAASAYYLAYVHESVYGWQAGSHAVLHDDRGAALGRGDPVHVPDLADALALLADEGASAFTTGDVGQRVVAEVAAGDGLLTVADLAAYEAVVRPALTTRRGRWTLATTPAPAIGGAVLTALLSLCDGADPGRVADVVEAVLAWRRDHLDLAPDREAVSRTLVALAATGDVDALREPRPATGARTEPPSTVTVSVVDGAGGACAVTASSGYGSGVLVPGTGVWLNNCLGEHELNRGGLHTRPPGERLPSNMAPTVGHRDDGAALAIGSPGADRITTALAQVLLAYLDDAAPLAAAVARPRLHVRFGPDGAPLVDHEEDLALPALPFATYAHHARSMYFGGVAAAVRHGDGTLEAAADPRRAGATRLA
jgi:gamma-glutamyltranspeptidase / glutathione hydrolase